jgi:trehalose 6-phosphate phosphatase
MRQRDEALAFLAEAPSRTGVFSDFDGTLSPVVPRPEDARPAEGAVETLETLARTYALVAVVSGRSLEDLKARMKPRGVLLAGAYGRERSDRHVRRQTEGWETLPIAATGAIRELAGVHLERKGSGVALHFRNSPECGEDVREIAEALAKEYGMDVRPGRMVYELIVPGPHKGDVICSLIAERSIDRALVAGDDFGDLDAFGAVRDAGVAAVIIAVISEEAPPGLTEQADLVLGGPVELVRFLQELGQIERASR